MNSLEDLIRVAEQAAEKIEGIITEEMENKATECVASIQADTPVKTGTLKRSMTHSDVERNNGGWKVKVGSSIKYAEWVEDGHPQTPGRYVPAIGRRLKKSFVPGKHMIRDNVQRYQPLVEDSIKERIQREV